MHQTFYIDIDEEITSVVDRLRKAKATDVIIVVPKRALLVQSIVNLKLLKKEADKLGKQISIVTQDKLGKMLIEKVGINVEDKLDDIEGDEIFETSVGGDERVFVSDADDYDAPKSDSSDRLKNLGSDSYFKDDEYAKNPSLDAQGKVAVNGKLGANKISEESSPESTEVTEKIINKELVTEIGADMEKISKSKKFTQSGVIRQGKPTFDIIRNVEAEEDATAEDVVQKTTFKKESDFSYDEYEKLAAEDENRKKEAIRSQNNRIGNFKNNEVVDNFFQSKNFSRGGKVLENKNRGEIELSRGMWKYVAMAGAVAILLIVAIGGYIFLPKVDIKLTLKSKEQSFDAQIRGSQATTEAAGDAIPAKLVSIDDEFTGTYKATGSKSATSQKAKGTISIYNEYSSAAQPLIASTRFETPDGKIFRLVQGVVVPGTSNSNGTTQPGVIEAMVVADNAGSDYNIGASTFSIPGFKGSGSEKYTKFYAKSSQPMMGGGSSGTMAASISATDIANAKNNALEELTASAKEKIKNVSSPGSVILDDAIDMGSVAYSMSNPEGDAVDSFTVTAKTKVNAVVFNEDDLKKVLTEKAMTSATSGEEIDGSSIVLQYGKSDVDYVAGSVLIRVHFFGKIISKIDEESLKKGILGKSETEFGAYIKTYPNIEAVEINYWPAFISGKIPAYESRINITLDNK